METFEISLNKQFLQTYLGVPDEERKALQTIIATVKFQIPKTHQLQSDELSATIDYAEVSRVLSEEAIRIPRKLLEKLAIDLSDKVLSTFPRIQELELTLVKSILPGMESVSLTWKTRKC